MFVICFQSFLYLAVKKLFTVKSCKSIVLELINNCSGFPQLDNTCHPVQDYLRTVRLWHKISSAMRESIHFIRLTVTLRHYNDRYQCQLFILLHSIQEGVSIHYGHHNVQENESNVVPVLFQNIQRHLTIFSLQHLIFI